VKLWLPLHRDHMRSIQLGPYIVPLAMLAIALTLIAAALWLLTKVTEVSLRQP
jgi:hypothetical protein